MFFPYFFVIYFNAFATTITMRDSQQKEFNKLQIAKKEKKPKVSWGERGGGGRRKEQNFRLFTSFL